MARRIALDTDGIEARKRICNGKVHTESIAFLSHYWIEAQGAQVCVHIPGKAIQLLALLQAIVYAFIVHAAQ